MVYNKELQEENSLYKKVTNKAEWYTKAANKHRRLNRILWAASSTISVLIAIFSAFDFLLFGEIKSQQISTVLALILPFVTGYVVLRSPEKLWIMETFTRNRLKDLTTEIEFQYERNKDFDREDFEQKFLDIMSESNEKWADIKSGSN